jgi:hypothetical protein
MSNNVTLLLVLICSTSILSINLRDQQSNYDDSPGMLSYSNVYDNEYYDDNPDKNYDDYSDGYYDEDYDEDCVGEFEDKVINVNDDDYFEKDIKQNVDSSLFDIRYDDVDPQDDMIDDAEFQKELDKWDSDALLEEMDECFNGKKPEEEEDDIDYANVGIDDFLDDFIEAKKEYDYTDEAIEIILRDEDPNVKIINDQADEIVA